MTCRAPARTGPAGIDITRVPAPPPKHAPSASVTPHPDNPRFTEIRLKPPPHKPLLAHSGFHS